MINAWRGMAARVQRVFRLIVLFCALRLAFGVGAILLFDRGAVAWGWELTAVVVAAVAVYVLVALAVRRYLVPHHTRG
ncbi:MAG: hypothetical protein HY874_06515 [Chloroflexi bacterium]|nr:hypothetical protein [Chloroflexota bacterium]